MDMWTRPRKRAGTWKTMVRVVRFLEDNESK